MSRKDVGAAPSVGDFADALGQRYTTTEQTPVAPAKTAPPAKTRRSWLLLTEVADDLTAAADRIHHDSRGTISKSAAQSAIIRAGLDHLDDAQRALESHEQH